MSVFLNIVKIIIIIISEWIFMQINTGIAKNQRKITQIKDDVTL